ncbi:hypothetical protein D9757_008259 [Collybiopsis confluens]|uniref:Uncharacterized protein n=1 Tax=Collybiopsis confluens TaxID=2823264 RepID=A0A8H5H4N3_9AGAR|nr:hypothetical protein D9757_008259 [Collybiopsis confluens]
MSTMSPADNHSTVTFPSAPGNVPDRTSLYSVQSSASLNDGQPPPPLPLPYLPFRRISLPSLPPQSLRSDSPLRRQSTQPQRSSVASLESFPEFEDTAMGRPPVESASPRKGARRTAMSMQIGSKPPLLFQMRRRSQNMTSLPLNDPLLLKRRQVIIEFYETEKAYVEGLDLIYEHFLLPILNSLDTPTPILERPLLTAVFSNFIDIWNLHRSFFTELTRLFYPSTPAGTGEKEASTPPPTPQYEHMSDIQSTIPSNPPPLSPLLLAHFPYLSLYNPFITAFPHTLSTLNTLITPFHHHQQQQPRAQTRAAIARAAQSPSSSATGSSTKGSEIKFEKRFADFVAAQEQDPQCGRLKLRDWLLTIVQRCPRYLLLLADLLGCTPGEAQVPFDDGKDGVEQIRGKMDRDRSKWHREATKEEEREREKLIQVYGLVSKITAALNTSIFSHLQTLALLALQRSTPNLPFDEFQFISPGRTLLKRGVLLQIENPDTRFRRGEGRRGDMRPREREFLLFSDCLVWLASEEMERKEKEWNFDWDLGAIWNSFAGATTAEVQRPKSLAQPTPSIIEEDEAVLTGSDNCIYPASAVPLHLKRPPMVRTRSKSEAELTAFQAEAVTNLRSPSRVQEENSSLSIQSRSALPSDKAKAAAIPSPTRRPTHKSNFARISKNSAFYSHFHHRGLGGKSRSNLKSSPTSARFRIPDEEQWSYKGRIELVNLEVVVDTSVGIDEEDGVKNEHLDDDDDDAFLKWRWEILSPEGSFVLYAATPEDRHVWTTLIRQAKSQQLVSLNAQHPNSTLTSSAATQHVRHALQALPFAPDDVRMQESVRLASDEEDQDGSVKGNGREGKGGKKQHKKTNSTDKKALWERRSKVDHWVPAIWIPDEKAKGCMRCGRAFGWRRRRHHCRLCGRCVCSSCSEKTFYISDPNAQDQSSSSKPARACNACYESVFPLVHFDFQAGPQDGQSTVRAPPLTHFSVSDPTSSSFLPQSSSVMSYASNADTITSLSHLPSWMSLSVPSLALSSSTSGGTRGTRNQSKGKEISGPEALMAIDRKRYSYGSEERWQSSGSNIDDNQFTRDSEDILVDGIVQPARLGSRIKLRPQSASGSRPRSYHDIVDDFNAADASNRISAAFSPLTEMEDSEESGKLTAAYGEDSSLLSSSSAVSSRRHTIVNLTASTSSASLSTSSPTSTGALPLEGALISERKEDTLRRNKRFSVPAVALQTTSVVARTQSIRPTGSGATRERSVALSPSSAISDKNQEAAKRTAGGRFNGNSNLLPGMPNTRSKRFSLVLGGPHSHEQPNHRNNPASPSRRRFDKHAGYTPEGTDLGKGAAATRLQELLGRSKQSPGE